MTPEFESPTDAFRLVAPAMPSSVILASPHSGRHYPADLTKTARLDAIALRRSEDAFVDQLIGNGPALGMTLFLQPMPAPMSM
jgi:N-formylglutamate amidohydrolase